MKAYHYTLEERLNSILSEGLIPSSGYGENLPFIMLTTEKYIPVAGGGRVYLEVEIPEDDCLIMANDSWIEFYGAIPASAIKRVARDWTNNNVIAAVKSGESTESFVERHDYQVIA